MQPARFNPGRSPGNYLVKFNSRYTRRREIRSKLTTVTPKGHNLKAAKVQNIEKMAKHMKMLRRFLNVQFCFCKLSSPSNKKRPHLNLQAFKQNK